MHRRLGVQNFRQQPKSSRALGHGFKLTLGLFVSEVSIIAAAVLAGTAVLSLALILLFLLIVYLKGGKDDLKAAAEALHKVRDVGVGPSIRAALERRGARDDGEC